MSKIQQDLRDHAKQLREKGFTLDSALAEEAADEISKLTHQLSAMNDGLQGSLAGRETELSFIRRAVAGAKKTAGWDDIPITLHRAIDDVFRAIDKA